MGHPILRQAAAEVEPERIRTEAFQRLLQDMRDTVEDYDGAGLAAPQVRVPLRVVLADLEGGARILINPRLTFLTRDVVRSYEGCLSVPGLRGAVDRIARIRVEALDERGRPLDMELEDFDAIVVQHECDHLDGILYVERVVPGTLTFLEEYRRYGPPPGVMDDEGG